jgi:RHS repeat-associated protein
MTLDGVATAYAYNSLNQLTSHADNTGTTTYTYDLDGNRTGRTKGTETTAYIYDYENRLLSVVEPTMTHSYEYDYRTRRIARTEGANVARIVFSGGTSYAEYAAGNGLASPTVEYVRGSDYGGGVGGILYTLRSGNASYTHYNNRGDVTAKTNDVGTATYQAIYEAFGTRTDEVGGTLDRQKANTKDEDPTGLLNEGFRYRDLETGTFITRDPLGFVDGPNLYAYVMQNPWTSFDPHGLEMISDVKSDAWARANLNDPDKWREEMEGRNRVAAAVADWAIGFVSYATAALVKGYIMTNSRGESRMDDFRDYPEIQAALLDLQEKVPDAIIQKPRDFVTYVTGVPDDDPARNTMETVLDVGSLFLGFGKMALGAPKYFKMAKLLFTEAKTAMALAAKQRQGMAAMERFRKIKAWYMQGSEADAAWMKMSLKDRLLYEIGQKTMKKKKYEQYEHIADVVQRGEKLVLDEGWYRAIRSTPEGLKLGIGSTFHTGPTPGIRWAAKRAVQATAIGSAVLAGYLVYEAATENDQ